VAKQILKSELRRPRSGQRRSSLVSVNPGTLVGIAETSVLFRFTDRLYRANHLNEAYEAALDAIIEALGCDRASILIFDKVGVMRFVAWRGLSDHYRHAVDGHSPWKPGDRDAAPILIPDVGESDFSTSLKEVVAGEGIRALAFIPIMVDRLTVGKFMAYYGARHPFTEIEKNVALTIARQLGFSIQRERAEEQRAVLISELNHRVKNTLATVQSLAFQTFRGRQNGVEACDIFQARLMALAHAHDVLTGQNWSGADLAEVVQRILGPFQPEDGRITIDGPKVRVGPKQALAIGMALHELATNASKHGALSSDTGRIRLSWQMSTQNPDHIQIVWTETGGPVVTPPERRGFGSRLIEEHLADDLHGEARLNFLRDGVVAEIRFPASA
jgi:two-component sensor histidine kinase